MRNPQRAKWLRAAAMILAGGMVLQLGSCGLSGISNAIRNFNPCGSVLACDPTTYNFLTSGYRGPGLNVNVDPSCTYPPFCGAGDADPFVATPNGGGG